MGARDCAARGFRRFSSSLVAMLALALLPATGFAVVPAAAAVPACGRSVFSDLEPQAATTADTAPVEVGVRLRTRRMVDVLGIRFFKEVDNTGTHVGHLWSSAGDLLRSVTFAGETVSGWQEALFETPVAIPEGTTFFASYHAPNGRYSYQHGGLADGFHPSGPVYVPPDGEDGPSSRYAYGASGSFPSSTYWAANYFVDVIVDTGRPPPPAGLTSPVRSTRAVLLTWSAPSSAGEEVVEYVVTRDGTPLASVPRETTSYTDRTVLPATSYTYTVQARGACGHLSEAAGPITVTTPAEPQTIFGARTPSGAATGDNRPVEVGVKFQASVDGVVNAVRFYRHAAIASGYVANLWTADGTLLATGRVVEGQSPAPGYQEVRFAAPVPIRPATTYVASYFASAGGYAFEAGGFSRRVTSGALSALDDETARGNGVYRYGPTSAFPTETFAAANYWVDVTFTPST